MKRLISTALAFSLMAATAAQADPFHHSRYDARWHDRHHDNTGTAVAVGVGLFALTALLASRAEANQDRVNQDRAIDQAYRQGYDRGYDQGYSGRNDTPDRYGPPQGYGPGDSGPGYNDQPDPRDQRNSNGPQDR